MSKVDKSQGVASFDGYGESEWKTLLEESSYRGLKINKAARHLENAQNFSFENNCVNLIKESGTTITIDMTKVFKKRDRGSISRLIHNIKMLFPDSKYSIRFNERISKLANALANGHGSSQPALSQPTVIQNSIVQASHFEQLPTDVLNHLFSFMKISKFKRQNLLNKNFHKFTTSYLISNQFFLAKNIVTLLNQTIKDNNIAIPHALVLSKAQTDIQSLTELQGFLLDNRDAIVEVLKNITDEDWHLLANKYNKATKPQLFNDLLHRIRLQTDLEKTLQCKEGLGPYSAEHMQKKGLVSLCSESARYGNVHIVKKVSSILLSKYKKDPIDAVIRHYAYGKYFKAALNHLEEVEAKGGINQSSRANISIELIKAKKLEKALTVSNPISDKSIQSHVYDHLVQELAKLGQLDRAITFANKMIDGGAKSSAVIALSINLCKKDRIDEALDWSKKVSGGSSLWYVLESISKKLRENDIDKAIEVANLIADKSRRDIALKKCGL